MHHSVQYRIYLGQEEIALVWIVTACPLVSSRWIETASAASTGLLLRRSVPAARCAGSLLESVAAPGNSPGIADAEPKSAIGLIDAIGPNWHAWASLSILDWLGIMYHLAQVCSTASQSLDNLFSCLETA